MATGEEGSLDPSGCKEWIDLSSIGSKKLPTSSSNLEMEQDDHDLRSTAFLPSNSSGNIKCLAQDQLGTSALCHACTSGNTEEALMLINKGANILISDANGDTPLHVAIRHSHTMIVEALMEAAHSCNGQINKMLMCRNKRGLSPMYDAVKCGNKELFQLCLNHVSNGDGRGIDDIVNFTNENKESLLHVACSHGHFDLVQILINHGANVDCVNKDMHTPLHLACIGNHEDIALCVVEHGSNVTVQDNSGLNAIQLAINHNSYQTLMTLLQYSTTGGYSDVVTDIITWCAKQNKAHALRKILNHEFHIHEVDDEALMAFIMDAVKNNHKDTLLVFLEWKHSVIEYVDELGNTPLHYAAEAGHDDIVKELIKAQPALVDAKNGRSEEEQSALHLSASNGWSETVRILLDSSAHTDQTDLLKRTPLHLACMNGHVGVVELLIFSKGDVTKTADITLCDASELICLDYAIDNGHENVVRMILRHERWREVMMTSSLDKETTYRTTPMRKLISQMPRIARIVLDRCITVTRGKKERHVEFYFEFLEDSFSTWMQPAQQPDELKTEENNNDGNGVVDGFLSQVYHRVSTDQTREPEDQYDSDHRLKRDATSYISDTMERAKNHPLSIMVASQHIELLDHPLVTTYLQHKWNAIARYVFISSLFIYLFFLGMLTGYIVVVPPNFYMKSANRSVDPPDVVWYADGEVRWVLTVQRSTLVFFDQIGPAVIVTLSLLNLFREIVQMVVQRLAYFKNVENYLELFLYTAAILFALPFSEVEYVDKGHIKKEWQWQCGAVAGFFAWINLLLFIRGNSKLGIYVIMFIDIIRTFLRFALILVLFIVAFGLAFYALLMNQNPFNRLGYALAKTFVMMIGELDYANIFFAQDYLGTSNTLSDGDDTFFMNSVFYKGLTYIFFCSFLVVMSILMMNMLVGLAVDDIQAIQKKASLHRLKLQVETVMGVQSNFPFWVWRSSIIRKKTFHLKDIKFKKWLQRLTSMRKQLKRAVEIGGSQEEYPVSEMGNENYGKIREKVEEMSRRMEQVTMEMLEGEKTRDAQLNEFHKAQNSLHDRCDLLNATQERLGDQMDRLDKKLDVVLNRL